MKLLVSCIDFYNIIQPTPLHLTVKEYVTPEKFSFWKDYGESIGFRYVASGPLVKQIFLLGQILLLVAFYKQHHSRILKFENLINSPSEINF